MAFGSIFHHEQKSSGRRSLRSYGGSFIGISACRPQVEMQGEARNSTMDIIVIGIGVLFFALSFAYIKACDSL